MKIDLTGIQKPVKSMFELVDDLEL